MELVLLIAIILIMSLLNGRLAKRFNYSEVIGLIIIGLAFSFFLKEFTSIDYKSFFGYVSKFGLFALMFLAGFEVSWHQIVTEKKDALVVTAFTMATSLLFGLVVFLLLGFSLEASLIMGLCFGITAEATKARILLQLGKLKTKIGSLLMGTGIINDVVGVIALAVITYIFTNKFSWHELALLFGSMLSFGLGIAVHCAFDRYSKEIKVLEKVILYSIVPFFFINIGLHFDISSFEANYLILPIVIITATAGQMVGSLLTKPITKLTYRQSYLIGWGMNSKGAVELAIAYIALEVGLIPPVLYSSLVVTTLVVSILFQIVIFRMVKKNPAIMD